MVIQIEHIYISIVIDMIRTTRCNTLQFYNIDDKIFSAVQILFLKKIGSSLY